MLKKLIPGVVALFISLNLNAQQPQHAFYNDVQTIKAYDKMFAPPARPIVFVGSSSIRKWDDLQHVFGTYDVLNRGIGGAVIDDIVYYLNDLVFAYKPRQIVLYVGENDVPNEKLTADSILNKTKNLFTLIRAKLPEVPVVYISFKPSPSRDKYQQKAADANALIRKYLSSDKHAVFVDIYKPMLSAEGKSRPELFVGDRLHMNLQGYGIWERAVKPHLLKPVR